MIFYIHKAVLAIIVIGEFSRKMHTFLYIEMGIEMSKYFVSIPNYIKFEIKTEIFS